MKKAKNAEHTHSTVSVNTCIVNIPRATPDDSEIPEYSMCTYI